MPPDIDVVIRPAEARDAAALGRLGALLMRVHYAFDPERFLAPGPNPEAGYGAFLRSQLAERDVVVLVAEREGEVVGYVYAGVEPLSWKELRARAGFIHDLVVDPRVRRGGLAKRLVGAAAEWLFAHGVPRVMLWTAAENEPAQQLFTALGFRRTMIEMTLERPV